MDIVSNIHYIDRTISLSKLHREENRVCKRYRIGNEY